MRKNLIKLTATITAVVFLADALVWAVPESRSILAKAEKFILLSPTLLSDIYIPEQYGMVENPVNCKLSTVNSLKSPQVILVKDAHCNYEAQHNIAKILEVLVRDYKVDLVAVEGAAGEVDLERFGRIENTAAKEKATDIYVKKGIVTGSEYLRITKYSELPFGIYGIEDGGLYVKNFVSFRNTMSNREEAQLFIDELVKMTNMLKVKTYSKELLEFDRKANEYNDNKISLTDWVKYLEKQEARNKKQDRNFNLVLKAINLEERIDFKKVEKERADLIKECEKKLPKEDIQQLVQKSLLYKLGKISSLDYYRYLENISLPIPLPNGERTCEARVRGNLHRYIHLVKLQSKIDSDKLFKEIDVLENSIKSRLFLNNTERSLDALSKNINILSKLFNLQLTREELQYFKDHKNEFSAMSLLSLIKVQAPLNNIQIPTLFNDDSFLKKIDESIIPGDRFYQEAVLRDKALVDNTLEKMDKEKKQTAVMITGGFHANGIKKLLQDKNVSYIVITPKITKMQEDCPYLSLMMDERIKIPAATANGQNLAVPEMLGLKSSPMPGLEGLRADLQAKISGLIAKGAGSIKEGEIEKLELSDKDRDAIRKVIDSGNIKGTALEVLKLIELSGVAIVQTGGTSFAKEISETIEGEEALNNEQKAKIAKGSVLIQDDVVEELNADLSKRGKRTIVLHTLNEEQWGKEIYFRIGEQRKYAVGLQREGENAVDVYVTEKMLKWLREYPSSMKALLIHESLDTGKKGAHAKAWQTVKKIYAEGMRDFVKLMIDNIDEPDKIRALIDEYEGMTALERTKKGWDDFEKEIYQYAIMKWVMFLFRKTEDDLFSGVFNKNKDRYITDIFFWLKKVTLENILNILFEHKKREYAVSVLERMRAVGDTNPKVLLLLKLLNNGIKGKRFVGQLKKGKRISQEEVPFVIGDLSKSRICREIPIRSNDPGKRRVFTTGTDMYVLRGTAYSGHHTRNNFLRYDESDRIRKLEELITERGSLMAVIRASEHGILLDDPFVNTTFSLDIAIEFATQTADSWLYRLNNDKSIKKDVYVSIIKIPKGTEIIMDFGPEEIVLIPFKIPSEWIAGQIPISPKEVGDGNPENLEKVRGKVEREIIKILRRDGNTFDSDTFSTKMFYWVNHNEKQMTGGKYSVSRPEEEWFDVHFRGHISMPLPSVIERKEMAFFDERTGSEASFAKEISETIEGEEALNDGQKAEIAKGSVLIQDAVVEGLNAGLSKRGKRTILLHTLGEQWGKEIYFTVGEQRKYAVGLPRDGENAVDVYVTEKMLKWLKENPSSMKALLMHESLDTGEKRAHAKAWQAVKKIHPKGMKDFVKLMIDNISDIKKIQALIDEYNAYATGKILKEGWDDFEKEIYAYLQTAVVRVGSGMYPEGLIKELVKLKLPVADIVGLFEEIDRQTIIKVWEKYPDGIVRFLRDNRWNIQKVFNIIKALKKEKILWDSCCSFWQKNPKEFDISFGYLLEIERGTGKSKLLNLFRVIGIDIIAGALENRMSDLLLALRNTNLKIRTKVLGINWLDCLKRFYRLLKAEKVKDLLAELPSEMVPVFNLDLFAMVNKYQKDDEIIGRLVKKYRGIIKYCKVNKRYLCPVVVKASHFAESIDEISEDEAGLVFTLLGIKLQEGSYFPSKYSDYQTPALRSFSYFEPYSYIFEETGLMPKHKKRGDVYKFDIDLPCDKTWDYSVLAGGVDILTMATGILYTPEEILNKHSERRSKQLVNIDDSSGKDNFVKFNHLGFIKPDMPGDNKFDSDYFKALKAINLLYSCLVLTFKNPEERDNIENMLCRIWEDFAAEYNKITSEYTDRLEMHPCSGWLESQRYNESIYDLIKNLRAKRPDIVGCIEKLIERKVSDIETILESSIIGNVNLDGSGIDKSYGNKAVRLSEIKKAGLPCPPAVAIKVSGCLDCTGRDMDAVKDLISGIESGSGFKFGDVNNRPLLLAVRSSPKESAPGKYDTILNVGLNSKTVGILAKYTGEELAYEMYVGFIQKYLETAVSSEAQEKLDKAKISKKPEGMSWKVFSASLLSMLKDADIKIPEDPYEQLVEVINAVYKGMKDTEGGIVIQQMVFGNINERSMSGILFTRNPDTGENQICGRVKIQGQGDTIVMGNEGGELAEFISPPLREKLLNVKESLEKAFHQVQDIEFVVEDDNLYIVQTRDAVIPNPSVQDKIWQEMIKEGIIPEPVYVRLIADLGEKHDDKVSVYKVKDNVSGLEIIGRGTGICGYASQAKVIRLSQISGIKDLAQFIIYVEEDELHRQDVIDLIYNRKIKGLVTSSTNIYCHAAILARLRKVPAIFAFTGSVPEDNQVLLDSEKGVLYLVPSGKNYLVEDSGTIHIPGLDIDEVRKKAEEITKGLSEMELAKLHTEKYIELQKVIEARREAGALYLNFLVHFIHGIWTNAKNAAGKGEYKKVIFYNIEQHYSTWKEGKEKGKREEKKKGEEMEEWRIDCDVEAKPDKGLTTEQVYKIVEKIRIYAESRPEVKELREKYGNRVQIKIAHLEEGQFGAINKYFRLTIYAYLPAEKIKTLFEERIPFGFNFGGYEGLEQKEGILRKKAEAVANKHPGAKVIQYREIYGYHDRGITSAASVTKVVLEDPIDKEPKYLGSPELIALRGPATADSVIQSQSTYAHVIVQMNLNSLVFKGGEKIPAAFSERAPITAEQWDFLQRLVMSVKDGNLSEAFDAVVAFHDVGKATSVYAEADIAGLGLDPANHSRSGGAILRQRDRFGKLGFDKDTAEIIETLISEHGWSGQIMRGEFTYEVMQSVLKLLDKFGVDTAKRKAVFDAYFLHNLLDMASGRPKLLNEEMFSRFKAFYDRFLPVATGTKGLDMLIAEGIEMARRHYQLSAQIPASEVVVIDRIIKLNWTNTQFRGRTPEEQKTVVLLALDKVFGTDNASRQDFIDMFSRMDRNTFLFWYPETAMVNLGENQIDILANQIKIFYAAMTLSSKNRGDTGEHHITFFPLSQKTGGEKNKGHSQTLGANISKVSFGDIKAVLDKGGSEVSIGSIRLAYDRTIGSVSVDEIAVVPKKRAIKESAVPVGSAEESPDAVVAQTAEAMDQAQQERLAALSLMLKIGIGELKKIIGESTADLAKALIKLLKQHGDITEEEIKIVVEQADKVEEVFKQSNVPDGPEMREKIAMFMAIRALGERQIPDFVGGLKEELSSMADKAGVSKDMVSGLVEDLYQYDFYDEYFALMLDGIRTLFEVTDINKADKYLEKLERYVFVKSKFEVKDERFVGDAAGMYNILLAYRNQNRIGGDKKTATQLLTEIAGIVVEYMENPGEFRGKFKDDRQNKIVKEGLEALISRRKLREEREKYLPDMPSGKKEERAICGYKIAEDKLDKKYEKEESLWQKKRPCVVDAQYLVLPKTAEQLVWLLKQAGSNISILNVPEKLRARITGWLRDHQIQDDFIKFITEVEYPAGADVVSLLSYETAERLDNAGKLQGQRVVKGRQSGEDDLMLISRMACILGSIDQTEELAVRMEKLFVAYYNVKDVNDLNAEAKEVLQKIREGASLILSLPPIAPFVKAYYNALNGARKAISQAA